jgi:hypothetical protein
LELIYLQQNKFEEAKKYFSKGFEFGWKISILIMLLQWLQMKKEI